VAPLPAAEPPETYTGERLSDLKPGERGRVLRISRACHGTDRRRLLDLGLTTGTVVETEMTSAGGDPVAYRIRGAMIALRREQANLIHMERLAQTQDHALESNHDVDYESTARPLVV
jgi:DtxR family Mn-dependent transcriptional regulator